MGARVIWGLVGCRLGLYRREGRVTTSTGRGHLSPGRVLKLPMAMTNYRQRGYTNTLMDMIHLRASSRVATPHRRGNPARRFGREFAVLLTPKLAIPRISVQRVILGLLVWLATPEPDHGILQLSIMVPR